MKTIIFFAFAAAIFTFTMLVTNKLANKKFFHFFPNCPNKMRQRKENFQTIGFFAFYLILSLVIAWAASRAINN